jgi:hypothetical protein
MKFKETEREGVDWINLIQNWVQLQVLNGPSGFHKRRGISALSEQVSASQEIVCSVLTLSVIEAGCIV